MGDCQNYGPFLGPYDNTGPNLGDPKRDHNFANPPYVQDLNQSTPEAQVALFAAQRSPLQPFAQRSLWGTRVSYTWGLSRKQLTCNTHLRFYYLSLPREEKWRERCDDKSFHRTKQRLCTTRRCCASRRSSIASLFFGLGAICWVGPPLTNSAILGIQKDPNIITITFWGHY